MNETKDAPNLLTPNILNQKRLLAETDTPEVDNEV